MKRLKTCQSSLGFAVGLFFVTLVSFTIVQVFCVERTITPSVPEFTVKFVAYPYDVPDKTVTTIDQYTGKETVTTIPGYHVENKSIEIVVKNQLFTPYIDGGHEINLFYGVQVKGHYGDDWTSVGGISSNLGQESNVQYDSEYTVFSIDPTQYPSDAVLDFRVQALIGYYVAYGRITVIFGIDFHGQKSYWSQKTFSLAENTFEVIPEFPSWVILPLFLVVTLFVFIRKHNGFGGSGSGIGGSVGGNSPV